MLDWYVGPWLYDADGGRTGPPGTVYAAVDFSSLSECGHRGAPGEFNGAGLFCVTSGEAPTEWEPFGRGDWNDIKTNQRMRDAFPRHSGFPLGGDTLARLVRNSLESGDPLGLEFAKPIVPTADLRSEIVCGPCRHSEPFRFGDHRTNRIVDVLQDDFRRSFFEFKPGSDTPLKALDYNCCKFGVDEFQLLVPRDLQCWTRGRLPHETSLSDDFNRANENPLGAPWATVETALQITSNQVTRTSGNSSSRHGTALSGADHYSQCDISGGTPLGGAIARVASGAATFYFHGSTSTTNLRLLKMVAATPTTLVDTAFTYSTPDTYKCEINGSTLTGYLNGVSHHNTTDSAITGNLYCGLRCSAAGASVQGDNFAAADLAVTDFVPVKMASYRRRRG